MRTTVLVSAMTLALSVCSGALAGAPAGSAVPTAAEHHAVWLDPDDPRRTLIVMTDGRSGLELRDLSGARLQALAGRKLTGVDLRDHFPTPDGERVLVAVTDAGGEGGGAVTLYFLDPGRRTLDFWASVPVDLAQPHGLCLARRGASFLMIVSGGDGQVRQLRVGAGADGRPRLTEERRFAIEGPPAGCTADDARGRLYLTEAGRGVRGFDLAVGPAGPGELIAEAPSPTLLPDIESLSLLNDGEDSWLVASSRADSAFVVWKLEDSLTYWYGSFAVAEGAGSDDISGSYGVAARGRLVGGFAGGLVVAQDAEPGGRPSLKLVDWSRVREGLGL